jgi:hypothetical protein
VSLLALGLCLAQNPGLTFMDENAENAPYILDYSGVQYRVEGDSVLQILRDPILSRGDFELRAAMAIFWLDKSDLESRRVMPGKKSAVVTPQDLFDNMVEDPVSKILREAYFEGPIEYRVGGKRVGAADAFYLNLENETAWIADAELFMERTLRDRPVTWRARAEWMRREDDGTLHSNDAVISTCTFEDRHLYIETEHLELVRASEEDDFSFDVSLSGNSLRAYGVAKLPLPPISWSADEQGNPVFPQISAGDSARFGTFIDTSIDFDAGDVGTWFHNLLGGDETDGQAIDDSAPKSKLRSDGHARLSWLGSRGVLVDLGFDLEAEGQYRFETSLGGLSDGDKDRGLLRVDEADRSSARLWLRSRGRFILDDSSWLDIALSTESDPGVQAEFWEDEFLEYEERDNYVNWRKAEGPLFQSLRIKLQVDSARTQVEELPSYRALWDRSPVADLPWGGKLLYSSNTTLDLLHRKEGSSLYQSPFATPAPFADGLGDREVTRLDSTHRFEHPITLGRSAGNWSLTPYSEFRGTAWDEDTLEDSSPTRVDVTAGMRLANTFWRRDGETTTQFSPFVDFSSSLIHEDEQGTPVVFDEVDLATGDDVLKLGFSARLFGWAPGEQFDMEVATNYAEGDLGSGWESADVFAGLKTKLGEMPVGFSHNGRYGLEGEGSLLSRSSFGFVPMDNLAFEVSHHYALDDLLGVHYEAATVEARYRWTPKWEFEARQTLSFREDSELGHEVIVRRFGHDLLVEFGVSKTTGEGGSTFTLKLRPELLFRPSRIGYIEPR